MAEDKENKSDLPINRISLSDKILKLTDSIRIHLNKPYTQPEDSEVSQVMDQGSVVGNYTKVDGKVISSQASPDMQLTGEDDKAAKKVGAKKGDWTKTVASAAAAATKDEEQVTPAREKEGKTKESEGKERIKAPESKATKTPEKPKESKKPDTSMSKMASMESAETQGAAPLTKNYNISHKPATASTPNTINYARLGDQKPKKPQGPQTNSPVVPQAAGGGLVSPTPPPVPAATGPNEPTKKDPINRAPKGTVNPGLHNPNPKDRGAVPKWKALFQERKKGRDAQVAKKLGDKAYTSNKGDVFIKSDMGASGEPLEKAKTLSDLRGKRVADAKAKWNGPQVNAADFGKVSESPANPGTHMVQATGGDLGQRKAGDGTPSTWHYFHHDKNTGKYGSSGTVGQDDNTNREIFNKVVAPQLANHPRHQDGSKPTYEGITNPGMVIANGKRNPYHSVNQGGASAPVQPIKKSEPLKKDVVAFKKPVSKPSSGGHQAVFDAAKNGKQKRPEGSKEKIQAALDNQPNNPYAEHRGDRPGNFSTVKQRGSQVPTKAKEALDRQNQSKVPTHAEREAMETDKIVASAKAKHDARKPQTAQQRGEDLDIGMATPLKKAMKPQCVKDIGRLKAHTQSGRPFRVSLASHDDHKELPGFHMELEKSCNLGACRQHLSDPTSEVNKAVISAVQKGHDHLYLHNPKSKEGK